MQSNRFFQSLYGPVLLVFLLSGSPVFGKTTVPFQAGEKLRFELRWFGLPAGIAELQVIAEASWGGKSVYQITATAESSAFFSLFYRVEDRLVSYVDSTRLVPWYFSMKQREGSYRSYRQIIFDHHKKLALYQKNQQAAREVEVPAQIQDSLSSLYYLRTLPLSVGQSIFLTLLLNGRLKEVEVRIVRSEILETQWGPMETLVVQPLIPDDDGAFREKRDLFIWLSNDHRRIPMRVSVRIPLGILEGTLIGR